MSAQQIRDVDAPEHEADERFCVLYRRYHPRVRGLAARRFAAFDPDDVAQETMVRVLLHAHRLDPDRDPWPYIAAIAVNVARDFGRARLPEVALTEESYERELAPSADEPVLTAERSATVQRVLDGLAPGSRQVLALQAFDEMSVGEIAEFLGTNDNAVRQKLFRARRQFRRAVAGVPSGSFGVGALAFAIRRRIAAANLVGGPGLSVAGAAVLAVAVAGAVTVGTSGLPGGFRSARPAAPAIGGDFGTDADARVAETPDKARGMAGIAQRAGSRFGAGGSGSTKQITGSPRRGSTRLSPGPGGPSVFVSPGNPWGEGETDRAEIVIPTPRGPLTIRTQGEGDDDNSTVCMVTHVHRLCR